MNKLFFYSLIFFGVFLLSLSVSAQQPTFYNLDNKQIRNPFVLSDSVLKYNKKKLKGGLLILANAFKARQSTFHKKVEVKNLRTWEPIDFTQSRFLTDVYFQNLVVFREVNFNDASFGNTAFFKNIYFREKVSFDGTKFTYLANFSGATFRKGVNFTHTQLPLFLNLNNLNLFGRDDVLDLTQCTLAHDICNINLTSTDISKIKLDYSKGFKLYFEDTTQSAKEKIYLDLLEQQDKFKFKQGYQKLLAEYEQFQLDQTGNTTKAKRSIDFSGARLFILITLLLTVMAYFVMRRSTKDKKHTTESVDLPLNYYKTKAVPMAEIIITERKGVELWMTYQTPEDVFNEPDAFWTEYEQLLDKVKSNELPI